MEDGTNENNGGIDPKLLRKAKRATRARTDREVITLGLQGLVKAEQREKLLRLIGSGRTSLTLKELKRLRADG